MESEINETYLYKELHKLLISIKKNIKKSNTVEFYEKTCLDET